MVPLSSEFDSRPWIRISMLLGLCFILYFDFRQFQIVEGRPEVQVIARRGEADREFILISSR